MGRKSSIKIKIPQAPIFAYFLKNNAIPNKISNRPETYIITEVKGKKEGTKAI